MIEEGKQYPDCIDHVEKYEGSPEEGGGIRLRIFYNTGLVIEQSIESEIIDLDNQPQIELPREQSDTEVIMEALAELYEMVADRVE